MKEPVVRTTKVYALFLKVRVLGSTKHALGLLL